MSKLYGKDVLYDPRFLQSKQGYEFELQSLMKREASCADIIYNDFINKVPNQTILDPLIHHRKPL